MIILNGSWQLIHFGVCAPRRFNLWVESPGRVIQVRTGYKIPWTHRFIWTGRRTRMQGPHCKDVFRLGVSLLWARVEDGEGPVEVLFRSGF